MRRPGAPSHLLLTLLEELSEITVEAIEESVHVKHVVSCYWWRDRLRDGCLQRSIVATEAPQCNLSLAGIAVIQHSRHEIPGMAFAALDNHHPHVGSTRQHVNLFRIKVVVAGPASLHPVENDSFDLPL